MAVSYQWQRRLERWKRIAGFSGGGEDNQPRPKICPACGSLVGIHATRCHECGASLNFSLAAASKSLSKYFGDENPVTRVFLVANIAMFAVSYLAGLASGESGIGVAFSGGGLALRAGSSWLPAIVELHQYYRLITASFLHLGLLHLGMNMMVLMDIGPQAEHEYGSPRFLFIYIFSGMGGFALSAIRGNLAAGASAALMGIIGLLLAMNMKRRGALAQAQKSRLISWIVMIFVIGALPGIRIDNWGHFGGLATGFILGRIMADRLPSSPREKQIAQLLGWFTGLIVVASFVFMFLHFRQPFGSQP